MPCGIQVLSFKLRRCLFTDLQKGEQHIKSMKAMVINIHGSLHSRFFQIVYISKRLTVKRLQISHKRICRRKISVIRLSCGSRVSRHLIVPDPPEICSPAHMIKSCIPHRSMVIPGRICIPIVDHGIQRHLKGDLYFPFVPGIHA